MDDNIKRGFRTGLQVFLGTLATGGLTKVWESFNGAHSVDPTVQVAVGLGCVMVVTWAQSTIEDLTGRGIWVPVDREVGDAVLGEGVGAVKADAGRMSGRYAGTDLASFNNPHFVPVPPPPDWNKPPPPIDSYPRAVLHYA